MFVEIRSTLISYDPTHSTIGTVSAQLETTQVSAAPLPAAVLLFATGLGGMGLLGWWRKEKRRAQRLSQPPEQLHLIGFGQAAARRSFRL